MSNYSNPASNHSVAAVTQHPPYKRPFVTTTRCGESTSATTVTSTMNQCNPVAAQLAIRNIKAASSWDWRERSALWTLRQHYKHQKFAMAYTIYGCLTEVASQQHSQSSARISCRKLGEMAGCSEQTARTYLHQFCEIGLISSNGAVSRANTYYLLAGTTVKLAARLDVAAEYEDETAQVTDPTPGEASQPSDAAQLVAAPPLPTVPAAASAHAAVSTQRIVEVSEQGVLQTAVEGRGTRGLTPNSRRGTTRHTPIQEDSIKQESTNNNVGVAQVLLSSQEQQAVTQLTELGVRRTYAQALVQSKGATRVGQVVAYVRKQRNIYNAAGLAIDFLRSGEAIPQRKNMPHPATPTWAISKAEDTYHDKYEDTTPSPHEGNVGASADSDAEDEPSTLNPAAPARDAATDQQKAIWQAARDELRPLVSQSTWNALSSARLVSTGGDAWLISSAMPHIASYATAEVAHIISSIAGRNIQVQFTPLGRC